MEPQQGKPVVKRRRWRVVAIAVLVLMSVGAWWVWPVRVDPRLIGEWRLSQGDLHSSWAAFTLEIRADGMVEHVHLPAYGHGTGSMIQLAGPQTFKVSGDRFEVSDEGAAGVMQVIERLRRLILGRPSQVFARGRIISLEGDKLVLGFDDWEDLEFVRVGEGTLGRGR